MATQETHNTITSQRTPNNRSIIITISVVILLSILIVVAVLCSILISQNPSDQYAAIEAAIDKGAYADALAMLDGLETAEASSDQALSYRYQIGMCMLNNGDYTQAISTFETLGEYQDSITQITKCHYNLAADALNNKQYVDALAILETLGDYENSTAMIWECNYGIATELLEKGAFQDALDLFNAINEHRDCTEQIKRCHKGLFGVSFSNATVGDVFTFGSYEQDNDFSNGSEDIQWQVLAKEGSRILVISKYALDCQLYNVTCDSVTWETSSIRKWLNTYFLQTAFSAWQQDLIPTVTVTDRNNPRYGTFAGAPTQDQIFLLSIDEAKQYFHSSNERSCLPTTYAKANGAWTSETGYCYWWLRTPGDTQWNASAIFAQGGIHEEGNKVNNPENAIRPAMWIDLDV